MPELCRFRGIIVRMYSDDHPYAHFHARYGEFNAAIEIGSWKVVGHIPPPRMRLLMTWARLRHDELLAAWDRMQRGLPPEKIDP